MNISAAALEEELSKNKKLIQITTGKEDGDGSSGSDSEPSEDNLEEEEMSKIIPTKKKEKPKPPPQLPVKKPVVKPPAKKIQEAISPPPLN